ncbi:MAG TPA: aminotransferase class IV, partial [Blastocatellia bacterium]|nr:aminotransferase class IV [Blastocatellia bacterium]
GLFETFRTYEGVPLLLEDHIDRLIESASALEFADLPPRDDLRRAAADFINRGTLSSRVVRLSLSYGNPVEGMAPSVWLSDRAVPYEAADYEEGIRVVISGVRRNEHSPIVRHKTFNQLENILAWRECLDRGAKECLFLNTSGHLAEGSRSNIFFVHAGEVFTPSEDCGLLPGITRRAVMGLLKGAGIGVREGKFSSDRFKACRESFATNSVMGVMPVVQVDDHIIGSGAPGEITRHVSALYHEYVQQHVKRFASRFFASHAEGADDAAQTPSN